MSLFKKKKEMLPTHHIPLTLPISRGIPESLQETLMFSCSWELGGWLSD